MSTFAHKTFDAARYLAHRPIYTPRHYDILYSYHARKGGQFKSALDVGCGPGFIALELSKKFDKVYGIDPAASMIDVALQPNDGTGKTIDYSVGSAEDLSMYEPESLDLIVAGQAAHWFDHTKTYPQFLKALRPGGTLAFFSYAEMVLPKYPSTKPLISSYTRTGPESESVGKHWQDPGRALVEGLLDGVPFPVTKNLKWKSRFTDQLEGTFPVSAAVKEPEPILSETSQYGEWDPDSPVRLKSLYSPDSAIDHLDKTYANSMLLKTLTWEGLESYLRTFSSLNAYQRAHPEDVGKEGGDVAERFLQRLKKEVGEGIDKVEVGWPLGIFMVKKL